MSITYWNGQLAPARRCVVVVADPGDPFAWSHKYAGQHRHAVEVEVPIDLSREAAAAANPNAIAAAGESIRTERERRGMRRIYLDDQGFRMTGEAFDRLLTNAQAAIDAAVGDRMRKAAEDALDRLSPDVGSPGWGWRKVTEGKGAELIPHAELKVDYVVKYDPAVRG